MGKARKSVRTAQKLTLTATAFDRLRTGVPGALLGAGIVVVAAFAFSGTYRGFAEWDHLVALLVAMALGSSVAMWWWAPSLIIGVRGVEVRGRFIPYAEIARVDHEHRFDPGSAPRPISEGDAYLAQAHGYPVDDGARRPVDTFSLSLTLVSGEEILLQSASYPRPPHAGSSPSLTVTEEKGEAIAQALRAACAAWRDGERRRDREASADAHDARARARAARRARRTGGEPGAIARGAQSGAQWLDALRRAGTQTRETYRAVAVDVDDLARLLGDTAARPSARAAAAIVLEATGDASARGRLRFAAGDQADRRLRSALEQISGADDDAALAEALEALEDAEHDAVPGRARRGRDS